MDVKNFLDIVGLRYVFDGLGIITPFAKNIINNLCFYEDSDLLKGELKRVLFLRNLNIGEDRLEKINSILAEFKDIRKSVENLKNKQRLTLEELFELKGLLISMEKLSRVWKDGEESQSAAESEGDTLFAPGLVLKDIRKPLSVLDPSGERKRSFMISDESSERLLSIRNRKRSLEGRLILGGASVRSEWNEVCREEDAEEKVLCSKMCNVLAPYAECIMDNIKTIGRFELLLRKVKMEGSSIPSLEGEKISLVEMHNPEIESILSNQGKAYVTTSITIDKGTTVVTGANMGGKSVALKTIILNVILAMTGFPVFCKEAVIPKINSIFLLWGNYENTGEGLSAFAGEMTAVKNALKAEGENSLLVFDEPAMGTNPKEGAAIVKGITEYLNKRNYYSVIVTHFDGVAPLAEKCYRIEDFTMIKAGKNEPVPKEAISACRKIGFDEDLLAAIEKYI